MRLLKLVFAAALVAAISAATATAGDNRPVKAHSVKSGLKHSVPSSQFLVVLANGRVLLCIEPPNKKDPHTSFDVKRLTTCPKGWKKLVIQTGPGPKGDTGATGATGSAGATGAQGPSGPAGSQGAAGSTGPQGSPGPKGDKGDHGDKGDKGDTGASGAPAFGSFGAIHLTKTDGGCNFGDEQWANDSFDRGWKVDAAQDGSGYVVTMYDIHGTFTTIPGKHWARNGPCDEHTYSSATTGTFNGVWTKKVTGDFDYNPDASIPANANFDAFIAAFFGGSATVADTSYEYDYYNACGDHWRDAAYPYPTTAANAGGFIGDCPRDGG